MLDLPSSTLAAAMLSIMTSGPEALNSKKSQDPGSAAITRDMSPNMAVKGTLAVRMIPAYLIQLNMVSFSKPNEGATGHEAARPNTRFLE